jgi:hypothetical protein
MIPGARANSLSFLLVSFVWLVLSPFWERCWLWCWRWNLLHLLRRLSLRLLRLRPVLLCRRSGPIRLHGLLTAWRRPAWPVVSRRRRSRTRLRHYVGWRRILPLGVSVGRRRTRPCDLRRPPAILAPAGVRGRLILPIVDHGRWSGVGLLHYVGRRSGVRLPLCIWRLRVRRAGPPGGGIHLAHTLLWSGANRRLNALDLAHVDDVNRRTPGRRILAHLLDGRCWKRTAGIPIQFGLLPVEGRCCRRGSGARYHWPAQHADGRPRRA